ncbi:MAG: hypothetical protein SFU99_24170 [Saprospiraceae bacterium]|nr:hypothetical protein [Saprospiraceae bacterium]
MQELKELVLFIDKYLGKKADILNTKPLAKLGQLYEGILNGNWNSDEEAAERLYPDEGLSSSAYRKLKMTLKQRLIDQLFTIDLKQADSTDRQKAYYVCYKDWAAAKLLLAKNARLAGIELCQKVLKEAIKYEFSDLCRDATATLRIHYGTMEGDARKFQQYNELYKNYSYLCQQEELAEEYYTELTINYVNTRSLQAETYEKAKHYYQQLENNLKEFDSYRLHLYSRLIQMTIYSSVNDYENTLKVCQEAIAFFEKKEYTANAPLQIFYYQILVDLITLKEFEKGIHIAQKLEAYIEVGTFNWFKYQELFFLLSAHTQRFEQAFNVFQRVFSNKKFQLLPGHVAETWKIFEAYLYYLVKTQAIKEVDEHSMKFKLGKFLNEIPLFSKDKSGMNIAILTIQILFSLLEKEHGTAAEQIEGIKKYCSRHLAKGHTRRSYYFIKMLLQIPQNYFNQQAVLRKSEPILEKLRAIPLELSNQSLEVEVIPYEILWDLALHTLDNRIREGYTA